MQKIDISAEIKQNMYIFAGLYCVWFSDSKLDRTFCDRQWIIVNL